MQLDQFSVKQLKQFPAVPRDRRKVFYVPMDYVRCLFSNGFQAKEYVRLPVALNLPRTAEVQHMWIDELRRVVGISVIDESFDPVPEGLEAPIINIEWRVERFDLDQGNKSAEPKI